MNKDYIKCNLFDQFITCGNCGCFFDSNFAFNSLTPDNFVSCPACKITFDLTNLKYAI